MNYKYIHLWQTPIYHNQLQLVSDEIVEYSKGLEYQRMYNDTASITKDKNVLADMRYSFLKEEIMQNVNMYLFDHLRMHTRHKNGFYITGSWINKFEKGEYAASHSHHNSLFSGVIYLQHEENSGGDLVFESRMDNITHQTMAFDYEWNGLNCREFSMPVQQNQIVLFPSFLNHWVTEVKSESPRYSLAFNVFYKGDLGQNESYAKVG